MLADIMDGRLYKWSHKIWQWPTLHFQTTIWYMNNNVPKHKNSQSFMLKCSMLKCLCNLKKLLSSHHHLVAIERSYETSKANEIKQKSCESSLNKLAKNATLLENTFLDKKKLILITMGHDGGDEWALLWISFYQCLLGPP
jgi:hypothetical protein